MCVHVSVLVSAPCLLSSRKVDLRIGFRSVSELAGKLRVRVGSWVIQWAYRSPHKDRRARTCAIVRGCSLISDQILCSTLILRSTNICEDKPFPLPCMGNEVVQPYLHHSPVSLTWLLSSFTEHIYSRSRTSDVRQRGFHNQLDIKLDAAMTFLHQGRMVALAVWALLLSCGVSTVTAQVINQQFIPARLSFIHAFCLFSCQRSPPYPPQILSSH